MSSTQAQSTPSQRTLLLEIFALAALSLYVELFLVRWVAAEIRLAAYFRGLVLLASFLGLGVGYRLKHRSLPFWLAPFSVVALAALSHPSLVTPDGFSPRNVLGHLAQQQSLLWTAGQSSDPVQYLMALTCAALVFLLVVLALVPFGGALGLRFALAESRGRAYLADLSGSLLGVLTFAALAASQLTPAAWWTLALAGVAWCLRSQFRPLVAGLLLGAVALQLMVRVPDGVEATFFSPYQSLQLHTSISTSNGQQRSNRLIDVNGVFYQAMLDERPDSMPAFLGPQWRTMLDGDAYNHLYARLGGKVGRVLILGAGSGNDAAAALRGGATHVDAVELDPVIAQLGVEMHPEHPYSDPRVTLHVTDARAFLMRSTEMYDVIVFGLLDSHSLSGVRGNTSLDSFVYTREGVAAAMKRLAPHGVLMVTFQMFKGFICGRLHALLREAAHQEPRISSNRMPAAMGGETRWGGWGTSMMVGDLDRLQVGLVDRPDLVAEFAQRPEMPASCNTAVEPTTDDWPYIYLPARELPPLWGVLSVLVGVLTLVIFLLIRRGSTMGHPAFFFLGAAFLFVELHTASRCAVLFGNTWVISAVAIGGVLSAVALGNLWALRFKVTVPQAAMVLGLGLLANALIPESTLLIEPMALRAVVAALVLGWPLAAASVIFIRWFDLTDNPEGALSVNMLGAVAGGLLESVTYFWGLQVTSLMALVLYACALLAARMRSVR